MEWCFLFITPHFAKTWFPAGSLIFSIFVFFYFPEKIGRLYFFCCTLAYLPNSIFLTNGEVQRWNALELFPQCLRVPWISLSPFFWKMILESGEGRRGLSTHACPGEPGADFAPSL